MIFDIKLSGWLKGHIVVTPLVKILATLFFFYFIFFAFTINIGYAIAALGREGEAWQKAWFEI